MTPRSVDNPVAAAQRQRQLAIDAPRQQLLAELLAEQLAAAAAAKRQATARRKATRQRQAERKRAARRARRQLAGQVVQRRQELDRLARTMTQRPKPGKPWENRDGEVPA